MIQIKNIYYMLAYAFQVLRESGYRSIETESFDNTAELMSAIICCGMNSQIKRGINKEYVECEEPTSSIKGKIDISESVKTRALMRRQLVCTYDEFSENSYMNKVIKSTMLLLLKSDISKLRKKELRRVLAYLSNVDTIDLNLVDWKRRYNRNNQTYRMLMSVCYLVVKGLLQTQETGASRIMDFFDEQRMHRLYEKFVLEYYRKEHPEVKTSSSQIPWQLDDGYNVLLPVMQTDIVLSQGENVLIIDTKYYSSSVQSQYGSATLHSGNLYQIFTYVKNKEAELAGYPHRVSGMLLYAKTDQDITPNNIYKMSGNEIAVLSLDLNADFDDIRKQLDGIVNRYFESVEDRIS